MRVLLPLLVILLASSTLSYDGPRPDGGAECKSDGSSARMKVAIEGKYKRVQTSGCPNYDWTGQSTPNYAQVQCLDYGLPLDPVIRQTSIPIGVYLDKAQTQVNDDPVMDIVGIAANGIAIFGNSDADGRDAYVHEHKTFDPCEGHPAPGGIYHYHAKPCDKAFDENVTTRIFFSNKIGAHAELFGFMLDGIPIFGPYGDNGVLPTDLDECNGHVDKTYPFYHYHMEVNFTYPYLVNCLRGCVPVGKYHNLPTDCTPGSKQYDYSSMQSTWLQHTDPTYTCTIRK